VFFVFFPRPTLLAFSAIWSVRLLSQAQKKNNEGKKLKLPKSAKTTVKLTLLSFLIEALRANRK
jgi:hypothetical protein